MDQPAAAAIHDRQVKRDPGIRLRIAAARPPTAIADAEWDHRYMRRSRDEPLLSIRRQAGGHLLREHRIGDFEVTTDGAEVVCHPLPGVPASHVLDTFHYPVVPFVQSHRGTDGLHAAAVAIDGGCIVLAGPSGAGKSTLAAAFDAEGFAAQTDEYVILGEDRAGVVARGGLPGVRLRPASLAALGLDGRQDDLPWDPFGEKRVMAPETPAPTVGAPLPLRRLYFLDVLDTPTGAARPDIATMPGTQAFLRFIDLTFRLDPSDPRLLARQADLFSRLIAADLVRLLHRPAGFEWLAATVERIVADARSAAR